LQGPRKGNQIQQDFKKRARRVKLVFVGAFWLGKILAG